MMNEEKQELILNLIDGFLTSEEKRSVELLILQDEEARKFYEINVLLHHHLSNEEIVTAPVAFKNKLKQSLAPQSILTQASRLKSFKKSLVLNVLFLAAFFILVISAIRSNSAIDAHSIFNIPFNYVLNIALVSGSIAILTYVDRWISLRAHGRH